MYVCIYIHVCVGVRVVCMCVCVCVSVCVSVCHFSEQKLLIFKVLLVFFQNNIFLK